MRENLGKCKEWLECKRFDLLHLWVKSIQLVEMSRILESIDELQKTPDRLEILITQKNYIAAVKSIVIAEKALNGNDLNDIGALEAISSTIQDIKEVLQSN